MSPYQKRTNLFARILEGRLVIVGVGNVLRGDDGLGPVLVSRLKRRLAVPCIVAGTALETHLGAILRQRPDTVLLIDAVHLGAAPGAYELVDPARIDQAGLSTHDISPSLLLDLLAEGTAGGVFLLGVQPATVEFGAGISRKVRRTLRLLERKILAAVGAVGGVSTFIHDGVGQWT